MKENRNKNRRGERNRGNKILRGWKIWMMKKRLREGWKGMMKRWEEWENKIKGGRGRVSNRNKRGRKNKRRIRNWGKEKRRNEINRKYKRKGGNENRKRKRLNENRWVRCRRGWN